MSTTPPAGSIPVIYAPPPQSDGTVQQYVMVPVPAPQSPTKSSKKESAFAWLVLFLILTVHLAANLYWLHTDRHLIRMDEAHHMKQSLAYHDALFTEDTGSTAEGILTALSIESPYPPLLHIIGAICIRYLGGSPDSAALAGSIALALLLIGVFVLSRLVLASQAALLVAVVTGFTPMVFGYARLMIPDTFMAAWLVWCLAALIRTGAFHKSGWSLLCGFFAGLAMLSKQNTLIYLSPLLAGAVLWGLKKAFSERKRDGADKYTFSRILVNLLLFSCTFAAVCGWWYIRHAEYLYGWWSSASEENASVFQEPAASLFAKVLPPSGAVPALVTDPDLPVPYKEIPASDKGSGIAFFSDALYRYGTMNLFYLINSVLFLPLALVAGLGVLSLLLKKNRNSLSLIFLLWVAAVWFILTGLFALQSPRFLYPLIPALSFFVYLALNGLSATRAFRAAWALVFIALLLQFINLSFVPAPYAMHLKLPFFQNTEEKEENDVQPLTVLSGEVAAGNYIIQAPVTEIPVSEKLVAAMEAHYPPDATVAWYQIIGDMPDALGVDFYTHNFPHRSLFDCFLEADAPGKHPVFSALNEAAAELSAHPADTAEADFIILQRAKASQTEPLLEKDAALLMKQGFQMAFHAVLPGAEKQQPAQVLLMARTTTLTPGACTDLFSLYDLLERDGREWVLTDEERRDAESRYARQISAYAVPRPLKQGIHFMGVHIAQAAENAYLIRIILHVQQTPQEKLRVWMRGISETAGAQAAISEAASWDFDPDPPSMQWGENEAIILSRPVLVSPAVFHLEIGLFNPETADRPLALLETETVDFAETDRLDRDYREAL